MYYFCTSPLPHFTIDYQLKYPVKHMNRQNRLVLKTKIAYNKNNKKHTNTMARRNKNKHLLKKGFG